MNHALTQENFANLIAQAKEYNACPHAIEAAENADSLEAFLEDENAPGWLFWYADIVIEGRWEAAEQLIATDAGSVYCYAQHVIGGRWEEAEPVILQDAGYAYKYARYVIKGRFEAAESVIAQDAWCNKKYRAYLRRID